MHRRELLRLLSLSTLAGTVACKGPSASAPPAGFSPQTTSGAVPDVELLLTVSEVAIPQTCNSCSPGNTWEAEQRRAHVAYIDPFWHSVEQEMQGLLE